MKRAFLLLIVIVLLASSKLISQNFGITLRSNFPIPNQTTAGIWGYVDSLGNEYALAGAKDGMMIINVNDPDNPFEVKQIPLNSCLWHEIRTYGKYAYVTSECGNPGVQIIDLSKLPATGSFPVKYFKDTINGSQLHTTHALHIDNGFLYLYGNNNAKGMIIADLTDPWNPVTVGYYDTEYIHDGYVRNNIVYAGMIYKGRIDFLDVTNKSTPQKIQEQQTPLSFTHNTWLSDDSQTLFATDEKSGSYVVAYDISNLTNITELDRFQCTPGSGSIAHNVYIKNDYAITSWYSDGVSIVDAHKPDNLVQIAWYDTHPNLSGSGFQGIWGAYAFLPSGIILASGMGNGDGIYILSPTYVRASYIEGTVIDSVCNTPLKDVTVSIVGTNAWEHTTAAGIFKTGYHIAGTYDITFSKPGYHTKIIKNASLVTAQTLTYNIQLTSDSIMNIYGLCVDNNNIPVANASISIVNNTLPYNFQYVSDNNGTFNSICDFYKGNCEVSSSKWGYRTTCFNKNFDTPDSNINIVLNQGYYDDFATDLSWTVTGTTGFGKWMRGIPLHPIYVDINTDCSDKAFVTGNAGTADYLSPGKFTKLTSPIMDLSSINDPYVSYYRWFSVDNNAHHDTLRVTLIDSTDNEYLLERIVSTDTLWKQQSYRVLDHLTTGSLKNVRIGFYACEKGGTSIIEAGIDGFEVTDGPVGIIKQNEVKQTSLIVYPNPSTGTFTINTSNNVRDVVITDIMGRIIEKHLLNNSSETIKLSGYTPGVYFIFSERDPSITPLKLIVN